MFRKDIGDKHVEVDNVEVLVNIHLDMEDMGGMEDMGDMEVLHDVNRDVNGVTLSNEPFATGFVN